MSVCFRCMSLFVLLFYLTPYLSAQSSGNRFTDTETGTSFQIPADWTGQKIDGGFLLGSNTIKGFILITHHEYTSLSQIKAAAAEGIVDENGTALYLENNLVSIGKNGLAGAFKGTVEWQQAKAYAASVLSPHSGGGITILAAVESATYNTRYRQYVESIVNSLRFSKPKVSAASDGWKAKLHDCRLTYMNSYNSGYGGGGYQDQTVLDLCAKGYFRYNDHSETVINAGDYAGGYSTGNASGSGQWDIISRGSKTVLQLKFNNGEISEYTLTEEDGKTFLNGYRYFRTYANSSVDSARPNCW